MNKKFNPFKVLKDIDKKHWTALVLINVFVILFVLLISLETSVDFVDDYSVFMLRLFGPYIITLLGAAIGGALVSKPSQKLKYSIVSILLFLIYALTPLYPSIYLLRLSFFLPFHAVSIVIGYRLSFFLNPLLIKRIGKTNYYQFISKHKQILLWTTVVLLFFISYPAVLFGTNAACIAYGNGVGLNIGFGGSDPIYWKNQRECFNPIADVTSNDKYCDALNYFRDRCHDRIDAKKRSAENFPARPSSGME